MRFKLRLQPTRRSLAAIILLRIKLTSLHKSLLDFFYYVSDRIHNFTTNVQVRMLQIAQKQHIASIRGATAGQSQFHETHASPSVQPIGRENLSKNIRPPADEIYVMLWVTVSWPVWLNGRAFARDPKGRGFESRPVRFKVTALGKLLTRMCLCHQAV